MVPYNKILVGKLACHINVEICTSIKAVKYLYKYTYKGPDRACLEKEVDEITEYLDTRYVTAPEACWRLFEYPMHEKSHVVERLPVHLEKEQQVVFMEQREAEAILKQEGKRTKLEAWYDLCLREYQEAKKRHREGDELYAAPTSEGEAPALLHGFCAEEKTYVWPSKHLRYGETPTAYVWDQKNTCWKRRQRAVKGGDVIGRRPHVPGLAQES